MDITGFSDKQLAGQRLMTGFDGTELNNDLKFLIDSIKVGGIILFARNLFDPDQIKHLCRSVQEYAAFCGQPPLLIAIDQEGGQVARLKEPFTRFPGNPKMKGKEDAAFFAQVTAKELIEVSINMNLAPVLDVVLEGIQSIMSERVFGPDPVWVSTLGGEVIEQLQRGGIMAVAKHFPGIGRTILDSHFEQPSLNLDLSEMESADLLPFEAAIKHDVAGIMLSHILYNNIDPNWPASLSARIARDLLRDEMGFEGVILTDDLDMGAIKKNYDIKTAIKQILSAEIDMALICKRSPDIESAFDEILKALVSSRKIKTKGVESVGRIMELKRKYLY